MAKLEQVIKRSGAIVPFKRERVINAIYRSAVSVGGRDKQTAEWLADQVIKMLENGRAENYIPTIEDIQDVVEKVLIENGHAKVSKAFILYRDEQKKKRETSSRIASKKSDNVPWQKIWYSLDWAVSRNLHTVDNLNQRIRNGEFPQIVHQAEARYNDDIALAAEIIKEKANDIKLVFVSGPSSSGKTTTTLKLEKHLKNIGLKFVALEVDHYFYDLELHPKDEFGDYDFETPQALDIELINEHLTKLCNGEEVMLPFYDFKTGTRHLNQKSLQLKEGEILLLDSLHGLYPPMSAGISDNNKFKIYIEPLLQMKGIDGEYVHWTDLRLIRRMLRDAAHRAYNPKQTLEHWHYVRASELRHIIPYNNTTDFTINSGMAYELPLYKHLMFDKFKEWIELYKDDPLKTDAYERASRIYKLLDSILPVEDDSPVPHDSVMREFIGGSSIVH
ncbi:MAG: response regulator SirA [Melioribacteraceae bacterium]|nr:response regulator SirA [Melioribacteraceae bacterium]